MKPDSTKNCMVIAHANASTDSRSIDTIDLSTIDPPSGMVVVAVDSCDCLPIHYSKQERRSLPKKSMLAYELEDVLPLDGDDLALGIIESRNDWLTIAVNARELKPLLDKVEEKGLYVRAVVPKLLLGFASLCKTHKMTKHDCVFWSNQDGIDVLNLQSGIPVDWLWVAKDAGSLEAAISTAISDSSSKRAMAIDCDPDVLELLNEQFDQVVTSELKLVESAEESSQDIVSGRVCPTVDLRNGQIEPRNSSFPFKKSLVVFATLFLLMQMAVVAAIVRRGNQFRAKTEAIAQEQEEIFSRIFPDERIPVGILSRIKSEHRFLKGTRGSGAGNSVPRLQSVVPISHVLLSTLPATTKARYQVKWIDALPKRINLDGIARSYDDLETVADALRLGGLDCPPASSRQTSDGVTLKFQDITLKAAKSKRKDKRVSF